MGIGAHGMGIGAYRVAQAAVSRAVHSCNCCFWRAIAPCARWPLGLAGASVGFGRPWALCIREASVLVAGEYWLVGGAFLGLLVA